MLRMRAKVCLSGDASVVASQFPKFDPRIAHREVEISFQVRSANAVGRTFGMRNERTLPPIVNGDAEAACELLGKLSDQGLLTPVEFDEIGLMIGHFATLTK